MNGFTFSKGFRMALENLYAQYDETVQNTMNSLGPFETPFCREALSFGTKAP